MTDEDYQLKKPNKYTMVRIKKDIKELARKNADNQHRSIANYIENLILSDDQ